MPPSRRADRRRPSAGLARPSRGRRRSGTLPRHQRRSDATQEGIGTGRIEVADVRSEEQDQHPGAGARARRHVGQPDLIRRVVRDNGDVIQRSHQTAAASSAAAETSTRWTVSGPGRDRPESISVTSFSPLPGPSSARVDNGSSRRKICAAVPVEQALLRPGDAIPRQPADRLEQRRPERVVQMTRRELARLQAAEWSLDVVGKRTCASCAILERGDVS